LLVKMVDLERTRLMFEKVGSDAPRGPGG